MEEKINREIRGYQEQVFMGLTLRQMLGCLAAILVSTIVYFNFRGQLGTQLVSWLCVLASAPFVLLAFCTWHGMTAERAALTVLRDMLIPGRLAWRSVNYTALYFHILLAPGREEKRDKGGENNAEDT